MSDAPLVGHDGSVDHDAPLDDAAGADDAASVDDDAPLDGEASVDHDAPLDDVAGADDSWESWERHAEWWQERFTAGADPEYREQIMPLAARWMAGFPRVLEVGAGEGQVARRLARGAAFVAAVEPAGNQLARARCGGDAAHGSPPGEVGPAGRAGDVRYVRSAAEELPFVADSFDAVLVCLVLEHIDSIDRPIREIARVLRPGGRFVLMLNHPLLQTPGSGWVDDWVLDPPEQYWRVGPYLDEGPIVEEVEPGVFMRFVHRPLGRYLNLLADAGFRLERFLEPPPPAGYLRRAPEHEDAGAIPRLAVVVVSLDA